MIVFILVSSTSSDVYNGGVSVLGETTLSWTDRIFHSVLQRYYQVVEDFSVTSDEYEEEEVRIIA